MTARPCTQQRCPPLVMLQQPTQPRRIDNVVQPNRLVGRRRGLHPRRQMAAGLVRAFSIVMQPPLPDDVVQVPIGHNHKLVEAFLLKTLDEPLHVPRPPGGWDPSPLATMSSATGRALATAVDPGGARRRDNREFRARWARIADADGARKRRAAGRDRDFETRRGARSGCENWR